MSFTWKKLGLVFGPKDHVTPEWMVEFAQAPSVILHDSFIRVYFSTRPSPDDQGQYKSYSGFVDLERDDLFQVKRVSSEPIFPLGDLGMFDEFGIYPVSVIKGSGEGRYRAYYAGWTRCRSVPFNVSIGMGISNDGGVSFKKIGPGPILSFSPDEPFVLSGPKIRFFNDRYYLFYIAGKEWIDDNGKPEPIYLIRSAISEDGYSWEKTGKDLIQTKLPLEAQASPDIFFSGGKYHMFFCYRNGKDYRNRENGYRIGYASSSDLLNWERDDERVGIDVSENGWDSEMISYPTVFELNGETYMFYLGNSVGKEGFGCAILQGKL